MNNKIKKINEILKNELSFGSLSPGELMQALAQQTHYEVITTDQGVILSVADVTGNGTVPVQAGMQKVILYDLKLVQKIKSEPQSYTYKDGAFVYKKLEPEDSVLRREKTN